MVASARMFWHTPKHTIAGSQPPASHFLAPQVLHPSPQVPDSPQNTQPPRQAAGEAISPRLQGAIGKVDALAKHALPTMKGTCPTAFQNSSLCVSGFI